jgi:hypothetical protein
MLRLVFFAIEKFVNESGRHRKKQALRAQEPRAQVYVVKLET